MVVFNQHRRPDEPGQSLSADEVFVRDALSDYEVGEDYGRWVRTADLYRTYLGKHKAADDPPARMDRRQFGAVVGAVFPGAMRVTRTVEGVRFRGYAFLEGPATRDKGRPGCKKLPKKWSMHD